MSLRERREATENEGPQAEQTRLRADIRMWPSQISQMSLQPPARSQVTPRGTDTGLLAEPCPPNPGTVDKQNGFFFKPSSLGLLFYTAIDNTYTDLNSNFNSALANCVTVGIFSFFSPFLHV